MPLGREVPLSRLYLKPEQLGIRRSPLVDLGMIEVPAAGAPQRYPFDWYVAEGNLALTLSNESIGLPHEDIPTLPYRLIILQEPTVAPLISRAAIQGPVAPENIPNSQIIGVRLTRGNTTRIFVVTLAVVPLLLALLLFVVIFVIGTARPVGPEVLAGVAAVLLAVLPIRFVLVPTEVTELTLVDYWLGFVIAVLTAVACLVVYRELGSDRFSSPSASRR